MLQLRAFPACSVCSLVFLQSNEQRAAGVSRVYAYIMHIWRICVYCAYTLYIERIAC